MPSMSQADKSKVKSIAELHAELAAMKAERDRLAAALAAKSEQLDTTSKQLDTTSKQLDTAHRHVKLVEQRAGRLKLQVRRLAYRLCGQRSEKLSAEETAQLVLSFGGTDEEAAALDPVVPTPVVQETLEPEGAAEDKTRRKKRKHPGRSKLSPLLERIVHEKPVPEAERTCKCCGVTMTAITPVDHERVEHVPEKLVVHVERREVVVCKNSRCRGDATTAERSPTPMIVRRAGVSLLASLIENKSRIRSAEPDWIRSAELG